MALGVRKTYRKLIIANIVKILNVIGYDVKKDEVKELIASLETKTNSEISLDNTLMHEKLHDALTGKYGTIPGKAFDLILTSSVSETKDAVYQAMEALIHNLNTMHSRAGAQVPFSSLNYGTDVSVGKEEWLLTVYLMQPLQGWEMVKHQFFQFKYSKLKKG